MTETNTAMDNLVERDNNPDITMVSHKNLHHGTKQAMSFKRFLFSR